MVGPGDGPAIDLRNIEFHAITRNRPVQSGRCAKKRQKMQVRSAAQGGLENNVPLRHGHGGGVFLQSFEICKVPIRPMLDRRNVDGNIRGCLDGKIGGAIEGPQEPRLSGRRRAIEIFLRQRQICAAGIVLQMN